MRLAGSTGRPPLVPPSSGHRIAAAVLVTCGALRPAHAGIAERMSGTEHWKDGCPAFFAPEEPPASISDPPSHGGAASFGVLPEVDSPLGPSKLAFTAWTNQLTQLSPSATQPVLYGGQLVFHAAAPSGVFFTGAVGVERADDDRFRLSNTQAFVGYRHASYLLGTAFRVGTAIRIGGGGDPTSGSDAASVARRESLAALSLLREAMFGFDRPVIGTLEARIEMVGCHAPFVDLRVDAATWRPSDDAATRYPRVFLLPISAAVGGFFRPHQAIYGEFTWQYRLHLPYSGLTRVGLGWEWRADEFHIGPFGDLHLGVRASAITSSRVTGWDVTAVIAWQLLWQGRLQ